MPRLPHGTHLTIEDLREERRDLAERAADRPLAFAAARPVETQDFGFMFPELQEDSGNLLPEGAETRENLIRLGRTMRDPSTGRGGDARIPAAYTYLGQFIDHDITLETSSADLQGLLDPALAPLPLEDIGRFVRNARTSAFDLDSVYGPPSPRVGDTLERMEVGTVVPLGGADLPTRRPDGKDDHNDLPREPRSDDPAHDRAALIGDPRNDENLIVAQLHLAFLRAHNALIDRGHTFWQARRLLRQHYQHLVLHDFLKWVADRAIVDATIRGGPYVYDAMREPFFMPLEFSVAAYRFGHSMVRAVYDYNVNFNTGGNGAVPATLELLFVFTALSGQLGDAQLGESDRLPDNWIIEWERFVDVGRPFNRARRIDTKLIEPLFALRDLRGAALPGDGASLAVRNLLRGYLLRMPTGQAVARALRRRLRGVREIPVLRPEQVEEAAANAEQARVLREAGFARRTPLWYYILAEAAALGRGQRLGPVGSVILAEVMVGLVRRSDDSILRTPNWRPTLDAARRGTFTLPDLLRLAGVLSPA
jgi:hypothetical protein